MKILLFGNENLLSRKLKNLEYTVINAYSKPEDQTSVLHEISIKRIDRVIINNTENKFKLSKNIISVLNVLEACRQFNIHCTLFIFGRLNETDLLENIIKETGYLDNILLVKIVSERFFDFIKMFENKEKGIIEI